MLIRYLKLTNYRRFEHAELELPQGIIGIIGQNGAGKSTLVEAVAWALYGNQPEITRTSKGDVKRSGTGPKDPCSVELEFALDGNNYRLIREIKGKAQTINAELYVNGQLEAQTARDTTELLTRRLGMDYKAFFASVFARQKELNALSSKQAGERKQLVLRMLNIETLEKIKRSVGSDKRAAKNFLEGLSQSVVDSDGRDLEKKIRTERRELAEQQEKLKAEIIRTEGEKNEKERVYRQVERELEAYTKKYNEHRVLRSELDKIEKTLAALDADKRGYERQIEALEADKKQLGELAESNTKYESLLAEKEKQESARQRYTRLEGLKQQLEKAEQKQADLAAQRKNFQKQQEFYKDLDAATAEWERREKKLEADLTAVNAALSRTEQQLTQLDREIAEKDEHRSTVTDLGPDSVCPTCERPLEEHHGSLLEKLEGEIEAKQAERKAVLEKIRELTDNKKELESKKKEHSKKEEAIDRDRRKRHEIQVRIDGIEEDIKEETEDKESLVSEIKEIGDVSFDEKLYDGFKKQIVELKSVHDKYVALEGAVGKLPEMQKKLEAAEAELAKTSGVRSEKENEHKAVGFDEKKYEGLQVQRNDANTAYQKAVSAFDLNTRELEHAKDRTGRLQEQLDEVLEKKKKIDEKREHLDYLTTLEQVMEKFKIDIISRIRPLLAQYGSEFLKKLTDGRYSQLELDENYDIYIYDEGEKYELKRYSGGEEDIANLSLRLAISQVIAESAGTTGLNMIILDEIFGSQDAYRKRNIINVLQELQNQYQQIFLITHVDEMKDQMGFVLNVYSDPDGDSSQIKVIS